MTLNAPSSREDAVPRELRFGVRKALLWATLAPTILLPAFALLIYALGMRISDRFLIACAVLEPFMALWTVLNALSKMVISADGIRFRLFYQRRQLRWDEIVSFEITDEDVVLLRTAVGRPLKFGVKAFEQSEQLKGELVRRLGEPAHADTSEVGMYHGPEEPGHALPDNVQEFRPRRIKLAVLLTLAALPAVVSVLMDFIVRDKPPSIMGSILAAFLGSITGLVGALVQEIVRRRYRLYLADEGFLVGARRTKQMALWRNVRGVQFSKKAKLLMIHVGEARRPVRIMLGMFANWKQVMAAIEAHLPDGVGVVETTGTSSAAGVVALIVAGGAVFVLPAIILVGRLYEQPAWCAAGLAAGVLVCLALARRTLKPPPGRPWRCLAYSGVLVAWSIALVVVWGALAGRGGAVVQAFAFSFDMGLLITQAVVLVRHGHASARVPMQAPQGAAVKDA